MRLRGNNDIVLTTARIALPILVESRFYICFMKSTNLSAKIEYVVLRGPNEHGKTGNVDAGGTIVSDS